MRAERTDQLPSDSQLRVRPRLNLQLLRILLYCTEAKEAFCADVSRRSGISIRDARFLLTKISDSRFCSLHHNHTRHGSKVSDFVEPSVRGSRRGFCVFREYGCLGESDTLRQIPRVKIDSFEDTENYYNFEEAVHMHTEGRLGADEVIGKQACANCRYIVTRDVQGIQPRISGVSLKSSVDRCTVYCILHALNVNASESVFIRGHELARTEADKLRSSVIAPFPNVPNSRFLPITAVFKLRSALNEGSSQSGRDVSKKTLQSKLGSVLAGHNIDLFSLSRKLRCYAIGSALTESVQSIISLSIREDVSLSTQERRKMFCDVSKHFQDRKDDYKRGNWSLSQTIIAIPRRLWACTILDMASTRQLTAWKVAATAKGVSLLNVFPLCNNREHVPQQELNQFAQRSLQSRNISGAFPRADFLVCIRAVKVMEQVVYSRSRLTVGPNTMTMSIAGIVESSPSWTSVLHALGLVTSYDSTENFRKQMIAEREQSKRGAFETIALENRTVTFQIDNFDMLPFHSVKAGEKALPMISGTATQAIVQSKKRRRLSRTPGGTEEVQQEHAPVVLQSGSDWRDAKTVMPSRSEFVKTMCSEDDKSVLNEFSDIVFGILHENKDRLLNRSSSKSTYTRGGRNIEYKHQGLNFRSLLLSCFEQHGGLDANDKSLYDQDVLFVDICKMSASDILTIHQKLTLIKKMLTPGQPGCPRFIVVCGDQPTYKMLVKIWRESYREARVNVASPSSIDDPRVHEWLIPFPGLFHVEKQSLYHLCKEMLHGMGLEELAGCCGLSQAQMDGILKHGHARNNRALLFSICASMVIPLCDIVQTEHTDVKDAVESIRLTCCTDAQWTDHHRSSKLLPCTTKQVSDCTMRIGKLLRKRVQEYFSGYANGRHYVQTVLFTCLLPTVGFHVLSRTGHSDLLDSFWLRLNNVLHTSGHIKYQELYLFYGFFRSIMPRVTFEDLFSFKLEAMLVRVPNFTAGMGCLYNRRGWTYTHQDESLKMLIIRLIKSLNVTMLSCLETAAAWLLQVCRAKMKLRSVTAATHSYRRTREEDNSEHEPSLLLHYDKNAAQSASVYSMVDMMRRKGFLGAEHRNAEKLRNVFATVPEDLKNDNVQKLILDVDEYGMKTAELHASAILPDVLGPLSEVDINDHFGGKRFRSTWTKKRQVPTAEVVMGKSREIHNTRISKHASDPRKAMSDRRYAVTRLMTSLTLAEHAAVKEGDIAGADNARWRWEVIHSSRYLVSPFADAYRNPDGTVRHAKKSQVLSALNLDWVGNDGNSQEQRASRSTASARSNVCYYYDYNMPRYTAVMFDLMNYIWSRGTDGSRGNSMFSVPYLP